MSRVKKAAYLGACCLLFFAVSAVAMIPPDEKSRTGNGADPHSARSLDPAATDASSPDRRIGRQSSPRRPALEPELAGFAVP